jgi:hypothetical protein
MAEIIDRSVSGFVDALSSRLEALLKSFWQKAEQFEDGDNEEYHTPHIHAQYLPVSFTENTERDKSKDCPYVQVYCNGGSINSFSDAVNGSELHVQILFFGYMDNDNQGWRIPQAMLWRTLQDLLGNTVLNGYQLVVPVKWELPISEEPPYYAATLETVWKGAPPAFEFPVMSDEQYGIESREDRPINDLA